SPVLVDGKIYIGDVNSKFHILEPGTMKCKSLSSVFFPATEGAADVEINGSPAVANGRVYFTTSDECYCIGLRGAKAVQEVVPPVIPPKGGEVAWIQVIPAEVVIHPGETANFKALGYDANGYLVKE